MPAPPVLDVPLARGLWHAALRIRRVEERVRDLYASGRMPGFIHLSIGQEGVAAGACAALRPDDTVTSTHRGHGHYLAKGGSLRGLIAELYGKATGCCRGKGGSMHLADVAAGYLGANGVLTAGLPLACGAGLSAKLRRTDQVCVAFFGDGAANRGPFHEAVNLAAIWRLPVVFLCENNGWASTTPFADSTAGGSVAARAAGYGIPGATVDGNDALAVHDAVAAAAVRARAGGGPTLLEARTVRWQGHFEGDPQGYRAKAEVAEGRRADPVLRLADRLRAAGAWDERWAKETEETILAELDAAVAFAEASPDPEPESALADVFVEDPGGG
ncbi:MAG: thiamine pyrophosphate-dependent dehydrogenase E1 component subunit alpha [Candidatus Rokubacteria bacterium]|nr:thiamine pyrophosphate-dependent dehydrogenase E1 component subunit alpha [Candidatus Rokubacteria bacterium]